MTQTTTQEVDACGLNCPMPILRLKKAMNNTEEGDIVKMLSTDLGSVRDVEAYCRQTGNQLHSSSQKGNTFLFLVEKSNG